MIDFDGYIIGYNQIYFDNPVSTYNAWLWKKEVEILNEKSLDLYVFFQQLTGKRMWLNKVSDSLVWVKKTLDSWADVESLWKERKSSNDNKILKKIQEYCKNDVRMTALVLLYLLHFQKVDIDNEDYTFDTQKFIELSKPSEKKLSDTNIITNNSLFP
jgi:wobble nucleotide-excising tRNase